MLVKTHHNVDIQTDIRDSAPSISKDLKILQSPRSSQMRKLVRFRKIDNTTDNQDTLELMPTASKLIYLKVIYF